MRRREFLKAMGLGAVSLAIPTGPTNVNAEAATAKSKRPNVLFLFTDDQRFSTIHALNNPEIKTPNMDKLVRNGTTFTHAYIMGSMSGAVCVPSRAMLMTGRTLFHLREGGRTIPQEHPTMPEVLGEAGYVTFGTGKWHNGAPAFARSFTHGGKIFFGGMSNHLRVPVHDFDPSGRYARNTRYIGSKFSSDLFTDAAIAFLKEHTDDKPFFMYLSYTAPHDPRMAPKEYGEVYPPEKIQLPNNFMPEHPFDNGEMGVRDEKLAPWPRTPKIIREHIAAYYAMITHLDSQIGRVLQALEESGQRDNTIIIFAGDNGLAVGQHGLLGKQNLYEHSVHVPLVMAGPGISKGEKRDAVCYLLDIFPTVCDLLGISIPSSVEGKSLVPITRSSKQKIRQTLFFAYKDVQRGVRDERHKLIEYAVKGKRTTQLFDLQTDPWELENLAGDPKHLQHLQRLRRDLLRWKDELDDSATAFWREDTTASPTIK